MPAVGILRYEFRLDKKRDPGLYQKGVMRPMVYHWMTCIAMGKKGAASDIRLGIGQILRALRYVEQGIPRVA